MRQLYSIRISHLFRVIREEGVPFILICTYLFFEYVRPQSVYPSIDVLPWVVVVLILVVITAFFSNEFGNSEPNVLNLFMVLYGIVVLLSSIFSYYPNESFYRLRAFFDWFVIYFLIVQLVNNERRFFIFFLSFLMFSLKMSQHGFRSWIERGFAFADWGVTGGPGWFHNSGEVGIQMCIYVPLAVAFILGVKLYASKKWLVFFFLMPVTGIGTVIASSSRGALLGLAVSGAWSILRRPKIFIFGGLILTVVIFIVIHFIPPEFKLRVKDSGEDRTSLHRIERWRNGVEALNEHPVFGVGFAIWDIYYPAHYNPEITGSHLVHNIFIQCGSELGYTGLLIFITMVFACFFTTIKVRKLCQFSKDKFFHTISYGFDAALIGFLVSGSFVTVLYYPFFWIHCAMTVCLQTVVLKKIRREKNV